MLYVRPGLLALTARYVLPATVALVGHIAVLFWPGHGSTPRDAYEAGGSDEPAPFELALVGIPAGESFPATEASDPAASRDESMIPTAPAVELNPTLPPPLDKIVAIPTDEARSSDAIAATLRGAGAGVGPLQGVRISLPGAGDSARLSHRRGGEGGGNPGVVEVSQLDRPPVLLRVPEFQFPAHLSRQGLHAGRVTVVVHVNASGRVSLLSVTESSHPDLIPAVCEAVTKALFQPPVRRGRRVTLRYSWTLELKDRTLALQCSNF